MVNNKEALLKKLCKESLFGVAEKGDKNELQSARDGNNVVLDAIKRLEK